MHYATFMNPSEVVPRLVYLTLIVVAIIFGNLLVIVAVVKFTKLRRSTNLMLASLAVADLMVGFITVPLYIVWTVNPMVFDKSSFLCRFVLLSCLLFVAASQVSLLLLSVERYLAVCQPFKHRALIIHCPWIHGAAICFVWVTSITTTAISSLAIRSDYTTCNYYGVFDKMFLFLAVLFGIFVFFLAIIVLNIKVFCSVRSHELRFSIVGASGNIEQRNSSDFCYHETVPPPPPQVAKTVEKMVWCPVFASDSKVISETDDLFNEEEITQQSDLEISTLPTTETACSETMIDNLEQNDSSFIDEIEAYRVETELKSNRRGKIPCFLRNDELELTGYEEKNLVELWEKEKRSDDTSTHVCFYDVSGHADDSQLNIFTKDVNNDNCNDNNIPWPAKRLHSSDLNSSLLSVGWKTQNEEMNRIILDTNIQNFRSLSKFTTENGLRENFVLHDNEISDKSNNENNTRRLCLSPELSTSDTDDISQRQSETSPTCVLKNSNFITKSAVDSKDHDRSCREGNTEKVWGLNGQQINRENSYSEENYLLNEKTVILKDSLTGEKSTRKSSRLRPVRTSKSSKYNNNNNNNGSNERCRRQSGVSYSQAYVRNKVARTVTLVCASFILAWLPFFVVIIYNTFCAQCDLDYALNAVLMVAFGQSASNPVIYALCHASFRRAYESLLHQLCSKTSMSDNVPRPFQMRGH